VIRHRALLLTAVVALLLVVLAPVSQAAAQSKMGGTDQQTTLTGQLDHNDQAGYVLIDQDSGSSITLKGSEGDLAQNVGSKVTVTGKWANDSNGKRYFSVSKVQKAGS
jgi:hypothetical protein